MRLLSDLWPGLAAAALAVLVAAPLAAAPHPAAPARPALRSVVDPPAIDILEAIQRATAHRKAKQADSASQHIDSARFDIVKRAWTVSWYTPGAKGGVTMVIVPEDGPMSIEHGE
jgi:hypothetical protein